MASAALKQSLRAHALEIADTWSVADLAKQIRDHVCLALLAAAGGQSAVAALNEAPLPLDRCI